MGKIRLFNLQVSERQTGRKKFNTFFTKQKLPVLGVSSPLLGNSRARRH